jgi:hypothetical protein
VRRWGSNAAFIWAGQRKSGSPLQLPSSQHSTAQLAPAPHSRETLELHPDGQPALQLRQHV